MKCQFRQIPYKYRLSVGSQKSSDGGPWLPISNSNFQAKNENASTGTFNTTPNRTGLDEAK